LAAVILVGTALMLLSTWVATLGWSSNSVPQPQATAKS
jgi:hypothetical protein